MKRMLLGLMLLVLLTGNAQAALEYNSFFDDDANAGRFTHFARVGEYIYWLYLPGDGFGWLETPYNLYRMKPGEGEAELLLKSGEEPFLIGDMVCIGEKLLLSVTDENYDNWYPAVVNLDGSGYRQLPGNIGSVVICPEKIYNSVDGAIYEIDTNTMSPRKIYSYPKEIAGDNPVLTQCEGLNLYFTTDSNDWYRLDLQFMELKKIDRIRGDGFVRDFKFYVGDYDTGGTYCYDLADGERKKISDQTHTFLQGSGDFVLARLLDPDGFGSAQGGRIFDLTWMWDDLQSALIGTCTPYYNFLLGGGLLKYDPQTNRVSYSTEPVAQLLKQ